MNRGRGEDQVRRSWSTTVVLAALVAASQPLMAGIRMARSGWVPAIDDGTIATRAYDVFSRHPPLVGQYSLAGEAAQVSAHSPGPMGYWLLALPARLGPGWTMPVLVGLVNAVLVALVVALAARRGGPGFAWAVAGGLVLLMRAWGPVTMAEIWNPWLALIPMVALAFVAWSVADGERNLMPLGVVLASFVMQAHLTYVVAAVAMLSVALVAGWGPSTYRAAAERRGAGRTVSNRTVAVWPLAVSVAVGVACWALPVYEQVSRDPGNFTLILRAGSVPGTKGGAEAGLASLSRSIALPPRFLRGSTDPSVEIVAGLQRPGNWALAVFGGCLVVFCLTVWSAVARRDRTLIGGFAVAAAMWLGLLFVAYSLPLGRSLVAAYSFRWFALVGLFTWLMVVLELTRRISLRAVEQPPGTVGPGSVGRTAMILGLPVLVVALGLSQLLGPFADSARWSYAPARALGDAAVAATRPGGSYRIARTDQFDIAFTPALAWRLRTAGRRVILSPPHDQAFGSAYTPRGQRCEGLITLVPASEQPAEPDDAAQVLAVVELPDAPALPPAVRMELLPDRSAGGRC